MVSGKSKERFGELGVDVWKMEGRVEDGGVDVYLFGWMGGWMDIS